MVRAVSSVIQETPNLTPKLVEFEEQLHALEEFQHGVVQCSGAREFGFELDTLLISFRPTPKEVVTMDQGRVSERAYALWEKAGQPDGAHDQHWQQACREIEHEDSAGMADTAPASEAVPSMATPQPGKAEDQERLVD